MHVLHVLLLEVAQPVAGAECMVQEALGNDWSGRVHLHSMQTASYLQALLCWHGCGTGCKMVQFAYVVIASQTSTSEAARTNAVVSGHVPKGLDAHLMHQTACVTKVHPR